MISSQCWLTSGVEIWGGAESINFEIWGGGGGGPLGPPGSSAYGQFENDAETTTIGSLIQLKSNHFHEHLDLSKSEQQAKNSSHSLSQKQLAFFEMHMHS